MQPKNELLIVDNYCTEELIDWFITNINSNFKVKKLSKLTRNDIEEIKYSGKYKYVTLIGEKRDIIHYNLIRQNKLSSISDKYSDTQLQNDTEIIHNIQLLGGKKIGIGIGSYLLNTYSGSKLIQNVEGFTESNFPLSFCNADNKIDSINITKKVNQLMYPFDLRNKSYNIIAWSEKYMGTKYQLSDDFTNFIPNNNFLESLIIEFPLTRSLCIDIIPYIQQEVSNIFIKKLIKNYIYEN